MMFHVLGCAFSSNPFRLLRKMLNVWVSTAVLMWVIIFPLFPALSVVIQKSLSIIWYSSSILITSSPRLSPSWCPGTYLKSSRASSTVQSAETPSHPTGQLPNSPAHGMNSVYYIPGQLYSHFDVNDIPDGWAVMVPLGQYKSRPLFILELYLQLAYKTWTWCFLGQRYWNFTSHYLSRVRDMCWCLQTAVG